MRYTIKSYNDHFCVLNNNDSYIDGLGSKTEKKVCLL